MSMLQKPAPSDFSGIVKTRPRTDRHRLNRGGNRRLNRAVHYVALTQAAWEPRAVAHL